jgi:hypothetical protein
MPASAFWTLKSPGNRVRTSTSPTLNRAPAKSKLTSCATKSAVGSWQLKVTTSPSSAASRRPYSSSTFTTAGPGSSNSRRFAR